MAEQIKAKPNYYEVTVTAGGFDINEPRCADGYRPIAQGLLVWAGFHGVPQNNTFHYLASAARKLDAAHRQLERARTAIEEYEASPSASAPGVELAILSDVDLALNALHRAIEMAAWLGEHHKTPIPMPPSIVKKRKALKRLRDAHDHIDARALGIREGHISDQAEAHSVFANSRYGKSLIEKREVRYRTFSLGLDDEATKVCRELRQFLHGAYYDIFLPYTSGKGYTVVPEQATEGHVVCGACKREKDLFLNGRGWKDGETTLDDVVFVVELPKVQTYAQVTCPYGHDHQLVREGHEDQMTSGDAVLAGTNLAGPNNDAAH